MDGYLAVVTKPDGVLLDVREDDEFKSGHVPGAMNIPRGLLEFRIWRALGYPAVVDTGRRIYVQCRTGGRATLAAKHLQDIGFTNVVEVIMTIDDWEKKGHPFVRNQPGSPAAAAPTDLRDRRARCVRGRPSAARASGRPGRR